MYIPVHFEEPRVEVMHALMRAHPLATLVTLATDGIEANHIPLHLSPEPAPFGVLRGHVARANPVWRHLGNGVEALAIFHGPQSYVSPAWYPGKQEHGRVVPTWSYIAVHAYGKLRAVDDPDWLRAQLDALTGQQEAGFPEPWTVADAPPDYIEKLTAAIVGVELVITRLQGKWKASQNQPPENRAGVVRGLRANGQDDMAALVGAVKKSKD